MFNKLNGKLKAGGLLPCSVWHPGTNYLRYLNLHQQLVHRVHMIDLEVPLQPLTLEGSWDSRWRTCLVQEKSSWVGRFYCPRSLTRIRPREYRWQEVMAEVLKAETKLSYMSQRDLVEAGGCADGPHNDLTNESSRQSSTKSDSPFICLYCWELPTASPGSAGIISGRGRRGKQCWSWVEPWLDKNCTKFKLF